MIPCQRSLGEFYSPLSLPANFDAAPSRSPSVAGPLSSQEAKEHFELVVRSMPRGARFTCNALFGGARLLGDKRGRGEVIKHLQRLGLIMVVGITQDDQEARNHGYAALWEVIK